MSTSPRFYVPHESFREGVITLSAEESLHASGARRLREGDAVELFDGMGQIATGRLIAVAKSGVSAALEAIHSEEPIRPSIIIATAIPKGKRWQGLVEKCTELGVTEIHPVLFKRSVVEGQGNPEKWRRWAIEASKQSRRAHLPLLHAPVSLARFLEHIVEGPCLVCSPDGDPILKWGGQIDRANEAAFVIGPEGGLTEEEEAMCRKASYAPVSLSPHILRIETAATAACALARGLL